MHFITFPVATTHIFPLVNSKNGGQYVTEYNLKSRESVATNPAVQYTIGPSFIHSLNDFKVTTLENNNIPAYSDTAKYDVGDYCRYFNETYVCNTKITVPEAFNASHWDLTSVTSANSILQVGAGRAVVNGHFIESLAPILIDLNATNAELTQKAQPTLHGNLSVGIKTYFSTSATMAGTMLVENSDDMYIGIQLVIEQSTKFKTPNDVPLNPEAVTADIRLADFTYVNGTVSRDSIRMNPDAMRYIPSERIASFDSVLNDKYITSENLVDRMFYTFSGKSGWCDSTDNLMIWDSDSGHRQTTVKPTLPQAEFITSPSDGSVHLLVPHKQQDGEILNDNGERLYYKDRDIRFPVADYNTESSGTVDYTYTQKIKSLEAVINSYKEFTKGKQVKYWDILNYDSEGNYTQDFPPADKYDIGDYIVVREDYTAYSGSSNTSAPSTLYIVLPGVPIALEWRGETKPSGLRLGTTVTWWSSDYPNPPTIINPSSSELEDIFGYRKFIGSPEDYFELVYRNDTDDSGVSYYYAVTATDAYTWSKPILLTGGIYLATESQIGGFFNTSTEYRDAGYVYLDNTGHLRLIDYALLRSGTAAYQLGTSHQVPLNSTLDYIQRDLDEYVNSRIAFPTSEDNDFDVPMIDITIPLPADAEGIITIKDIDSRFSTGIYLHFAADDKTKDYSNITINISNCEKIRIDNSVTTWEKGPVINVFRSCLYYDASVINYIITRNRALDNPLFLSLLPDYYELSNIDFTGFDGLTLWYSRFSSSDPDLVINGMEIFQPNVVVSQELDFWREHYITGDNHYSYALRSITMSNYGKIVACSLYVSNDSTPDVNATQHTIIGGKFELPQGSNLNYPSASLQSPLKITGVFTTAYKDTSGTKWITTETSFTAKTGTYDIATGMGDGSIAFNSSTDLIETAYTNVDTLDGWAPGSYHIFYGGTIN